MIEFELQSAAGEKEASWGEETRTAGKSPMCLCANSSFAFAFAFQTHLLTSCCNLIPLPSFYI